MKTNEQKMHDEELYMVDDNLSRQYIECRRLINKFNNTEYNAFDERKSIIKQLFGGTKNHFSIQAPLYCDYGKNIYIGENFYANYDCVLLDVGKITIGDNVLLAPRVQIYTAGHPIDRDVRNTTLEYGKNVTIGNDVWIGGGAIINPGVTIGDNVVIGSGSVVVKDIPSNCVAVGNPCKKIRDINDDDKKYWNEQKDNYYKTIIK